MDIQISKATLSGQIPAIPSKSDAHRLLICAALADKPTRLHLPSGSDDITATCRCLLALGAGIVRDGEFLTVNPIASVPESPVLDCGESGSTLRFMLPVAAAVADKPSFTGLGRLPDRPISELTEAMAAHGVSFSSGKLPFGLSGRLAPGRYALAGNVSSQYITGLLLGLAALGKESEIELTTELESAAYIDITLHAMRRFGIEIERTASGWHIPANSGFKSPGTLAVDGDWSNAAFFLAAGALGKGITVTCLDIASPQGDKAILDVMRRFGARIEVKESSVTVYPSELSGCTVDMREIPDALPILAVLAACAKGETNFVNAGRLRLKESDRIASVAKMLASLGISAAEHSEGLTVSGGKPRAGRVDGANDHRIVMAAAIAGSLADGKTAVTGAEAVNKSYPRFFEDFSRLGGISNGI